jgi:hypothetical protein
MAISIRQQQEAAQASASIATLGRRAVVAHIGCAEHHHTFAWASRQAIAESSSATIVMSLCADLHALHLEAIQLADEIQVLNLAGHIDPRTLHELCVAHNLGKPISWMENWPMDCPVCRVSGPESEHFFHTALDLEDLNGLLASDGAAEHLCYLEGELVDWYGQVAPIVLLSNGLPALQVDLACPRCSRLHCTVYAVPGEYGAWAVLVDADGRYLTNLCEADERMHTLACSGCIQVVGAEVHDGE